MNHAHWQRVESIFQGAIERPESARATYLDEACGGDAKLKAEVLGLLTAAETDPEFLQPLVDLSARGTRDAERAEGENEGDASRVPRSTSRIGPYRLIREVGSGGMGVVYLAMHEGPDFERPVALKVIRRGLDTEDLLKRFQLERRILAALKHPNVARLTDAGQTDDGRPYFVMDFVEGVPIDTYCDRAQLTLRQRLRLVKLVCDAVQHAHNNLIIHRDLKPGNILVAEDGTPVLLDFGIGKLVDPTEARDVDTTKTSARAFTPEYAAPEQLRGEPVSTATDVYGLGLLLYLLLAGRKPFQPETGFDYEKAVLTREPTRPSAYGGRQLVGDLDTIVLKSLRKEPERRYSSVGALADDIVRYLDGLPVRARPDTFGYRTGKFIRRYPLAIAASVIAAGSLIAATVYSQFQTRAVIRERDKAIEVQAFLLEMFGAAGQQRTDTVSVRQLLDAQVALVPDAYRERPELGAQMVSVLAEGFDRMGVFAKAESLATEAVEERRRILPPNHSDLAFSIGLLGWIKHERGKSNDGEALLREALAIWPTARPRNERSHARTLNDLGVVREAAGAYDEAGALYRQALAIRRRLFGENDRSVGITLSNLSVVHYRKGDFRGAVAVAESALAVMRKVHGPDHQRSSLIQGNIASYRTGMGDLVGAEREYRELVERQTRVQGRQNPVTGGVLLGLGTVLRSQGKYAEAETVLVETLSIFEAAYGTDHARVANTALNLGSVRSAQRKFREARPMIQRAVAIQRRLHPAPHRDVANALSVLATMHGDAGDWVAAERVHREAVDVYMKSQGPKHVETATARGRLARAVFERRRPAEAYALFKEAHDVMVAAGVQPNAATLRDARLRMAQSLSALSRRAESDSILRVVGESGWTRSQKALLDSLKASNGRGPNH